MQFDRLPHIWSRKSCYDEKMMQISRQLFLLFALLACVIWAPPVSGQASELVHAKKVVPHWKLNSIGGAPAFTSSLSTTDLFYNFDIEGRRYVATVRAISSNGSNPTFSYDDSRNYSEDWEYKEHTIGIVGTIDGPLRTTMSAIATLWVGDDPSSSASAPAGSSASADAAGSIAYASTTMPNGFLCGVAAAQASEQTQGTAGGFSIQVMGSGFGASYSRPYSTGWGPDVSNLDLTATDSGSVEDLWKFETQTHAGASASAFNAGGGSVLVTAVGTGYGSCTGEIILAETGWSDE